MALHWQNELDMTRNPVKWFGEGISRVMAIFLLVIMIVPMFLVAVVIRCTLGPPVFYRQVRVGCGMVNFEIWKFRTMHELRNDKGHLQPDALRVTAVTRLLRKSRLDELPQLFAIAGGSMAFIGPRPLLPVTIRSMGQKGELRCRIRPGLSGWAQVNGNTKLSDAQKLSLDIWYIDHRGLYLDIAILFMTIWTLICGERLNAQNIAVAESYVNARYGTSSNSSVDQEA